MTPSLRHYISLLESPAVTSQPGFKEWFGDSKIVDASGSPLILYRGLYGEYSATAERMEPRQGYATFFSTSPYVASTYSTPDTGGFFADKRGNQGAIYPVFIKAATLREFPVRVGSDGNRRFDMFAFDDAARRLPPGAAIVARDVYDLGPRASYDHQPTEKWTANSDIYAIGKGTSVKSAVSNSGTFKPDADSHMSEGSVHPVRRIMDLVEAAQTEQPHPDLAHALWWMQRWISGSIEDPDWDWPEAEAMGLEAAFAMIGGAVGNKLAMRRKVLWRVLSVPKAMAVRIARTKMLPPNPKSPFQSFSGKRSVSVEFGEDLYQAPGSVLILVSAAPNASLIPFSMADVLKSANGEVSSWAAALEDWHHQDEVLVHVTAPLPLLSVEML